jgi:hypothetical protein
MPRFNTYGQPEAHGFGFETPPQFPSRSIDMTPPRATVELGADPNNLTNQLAIILRESFGIEPKGWGRVYQKLYPDYYGQLPYPRGYRVPEFSKFSGEDGKTTLEHVGQFILQCGEAGANEVLQLRMFSLSLSGTTFTWFTSLAPNSIFTWAQLEQKLLGPMGEAKPDEKKSLEEVAAEQSRVLEPKTETRIEVRTSSWWPPNETV